jgi:hypothetical protein
MRRTRTPGIPDPRSPIHVRVSSSTSPLLVGLSDIARSRFLAAAFSLHSLETPKMPPIPTPRDLSPRVPPMDGPGLPSGNRESRFQYASVLCPRKPRYPDGQNSDGACLLDTCPAEING